MTGWSSKPEWPTGKAIAEKQALAGEEEFKILSDAIAKTGEAILSGIDLGAGSQTVLTTFEDGKLKSRIVTSEELYVKPTNNQYGKFNTEPREYTNLKPTHDPYTNPNAQLYYECKCGAILDPGVKSFASLNNAASDQGWKVRWKSDGMGYEPFCVECGKDVPE
jgi:hypothetical protein